MCLPDATRIILRLARRIHQEYCVTTPGPAPGDASTAQQRCPLMPSRLSMSSARRANARHVAPRLASVGASSQRAQEPVPCDEQTRRGLEASRSLPVGSRTWGERREAVRKAHADEASDAQIGVGVFPPSKRAARRGRLDGRAYASHPACIRSPSRRGLPSVPQTAGWGQRSPWAARSCVGGSMPAHECC